jgi:hypothetical protein
VDIQRWFAIESPKEMSEVFAEISVLYHISQIGRQGKGRCGLIERRLEEIRDSSEWFASCMYLEDVRQHQGMTVRWEAVHRGA